MKKILLALVLMSYTGFSQVIDFSRYDTFLKKNVSAKGVVDYDKVLKNLNELKDITNSFAKISPNGSWTINEKKAYWVNVYNVNMIKILVENYPIKSITYVPTAFSDDYVSHDGKKVSLDHIQKEILREYNDPRIHFVLYDTSVSSPVLRNYAFSAANMDAELENSTREFLNDPTKNTINAGETKLSKIFEWHITEFIGKNTLPDFVNKYASSQINGETPISFLEFDWSLYK